MNDVPKKFIERYEKISPEATEFFEILKTMPPKSFRINTLKAQKNEVLERLQNYGFEINQSLFSDVAFTTSSLELGKTLEHFLGHIYMQELASMLPPIIAEKELQNADFVLDACAAPGSKTTQSAAIMKNRGTLVANDNSYERIRALKFNLEKTGTLNTIITNQDFRFFSDPHFRFDVILVDAPCSGEGTVRRSDVVFRLWNEKYINLLSNLQKQIIVKAFDLLKPDGVLVYSTCTYAPEENEEVLDYLLQKREDAKIEKTDLPTIKHSKGVTEWNSKYFSNEVENALRLWPHQNNTEGFFVAKVSKNG